MSRRPALLVASLAALACSAVLGACGSNSLDVAAIDDENLRGAQLFDRNCGMCHTLSVTGNEGSAIKITDQERVDGPNFNVRVEDKDDVLYAIRNGGFSGAIMPANIVVGQDAEEVAEFLSKYAGSEAADTDVGSPTP